MTIKYKIVRFNNGKYGVQVTSEEWKEDKELYLNDGSFVSHCAIGCRKEWNESLQKDNIYLCEDLIERHKKQFEDAKLFVEEIVEIVE